VIRYDDEVSEDAELTLPHPRAHLRAFVLAPWQDVAPDAELPGLGPIAELLAGLGGAGAQGRTGGMTSFCRCRRTRRQGAKHPENIDRADGFFGVSAVAVRLECGVVHCRPVQYRPVQCERSGDEVDQRGDGGRLAGVVGFVILRVL